MTILSYDIVSDDRQAIGRRLATLCENSRKYRKWAFLGSFLFAAILTPTPDPFNQCIMALPMYFFYEIGIICAQVFGKKKPRDDDAPSASSTPPSADTRSQLEPRPGGVGAGGDDDYVSVPDSGPR